VSRVHRSQLYNSLTVPHLLALAPVWSFFNCGKRKQVHCLYFKFAKYLMELPTWTSNSFLQRKYQLVNLAGIIEKRIFDFSTECEKCSHLWLFFCPLFVVVKVFLFLLFLFLLCLFLGSAQYFVMGYK
jgi:hypothetical protein